MLKHQTPFLTITSVLITFNTSAKKPFQVRSKNSRFDCEYISTFLSNKDLRKLYNKSLESAIFFKKHFFLCGTEESKFYPCFHFQITVWCGYHKAIEIYHCRILFLVDFVVGFFFLHLKIKYVSVFKMITEINRKKSMMMEVLSLMFSLQFKSKPKRNFFLGHPVVILCLLLILQNRTWNDWDMAETNIVSNSISGRLTGG